MEKERRFFKAAGIRKKGSLLTPALGIDTVTVERCGGVAPWTVALTGGDQLNKVQGLLVLRDAPEEGGVLDDSRQRAIDAAAA